MIRSIASGILLCIAALTLALAPGSESSSFRPAATHAPLTHDVYVWQRRVDASVRHAWEGIASSVTGGRVLAWQGRIDANGRLTAEHELSWSEMPRGPARWTATLRVGPVRGDLGAASLDAAWRQIATAALRALAEAQRAGVEVGGIEIDFDAHPAQLDAYRRRLATLRVALPPGCEMSLTALPVWLSHRAFATLAAENPGYVLQVHNLGREPDGTLVIFDAGRALRAVDRAGRLGVPFRLALPTYAHVVHDGAKHRHLVRSDPRVLAPLVRHLHRERPPALRGLTWFRMATEGDRSAWGRATLIAVMRGEAPPPARPRLEVRESEPGLVEITLANPGDEPIALDSPLDLSWPEHSAGLLIAFDAYSGFRALRPDPARLRIAAAAGGDTVLPPGRATAAAWARFAGPVPKEILR